MSSEAILIWNVRGLNGRARRNTLRKLVVAERPLIICIQESKLDVICDFDVLQMIGSGYDSFCLPTVQTHGGILVAWRTDTWEVSLCNAPSFSVSAKFLPRGGGGGGGMIAGR
jgi:exonuclease III